MPRGPHPSALQTSLSFVQRSQVPFKCRKHAGPALLQPRREGSQDTGRAQGRVLPGAPASRDPALSGQGGLCLRGHGPLRHPPAQLAPPARKDTGYTGRGRWGGRGQPFSRGGPPEAALGPGAAPPHPTAESRTTIGSPPLWEDMGTCHKDSPAEPKPGRQEIQAGRQRAHLYWNSRKLACAGIPQEAIYYVLWYTDELKGGINFLSQLAVADLSFFRLCHRYSTSVVNCLFKSVCIHTGTRPSGVPGPGGMAKTGLRGLACLSAPLCSAHRAGPQ